MRAARTRRAAGIGVRLGLAVGALLLLPASPGAAAAEEQSLEDHFSHQWYITEVVVFQRPQVQDHDSGEELVQPPAPLPHSLESFVDAPRALDSSDLAARLDPATRTCLTFPVLDLASLPPALRQLQLAPGESAGKAAPGPVPEPAVSSGADGAPAADEAGAASAGVAPPPIHPRLAPDPLLDFLDQLAAFESSLEAQSYRWLPPDTFTLTNEARRLQRRGGYQVLLHGRWLQPVPPRDAPEPLWIQAGPRYGDRSALEGAFEVTVGRYLHFRSALYYTEPLLGRSPVNRAVPPPGTAAAPDDVALSADALTPAGYMQLTQSRRMRSGELHYIDHPKLGILVRIEPVPVPESLSEAYAALEEGSQ